MHPITALIHHKIATIINRYDVGSIMDVGGVGKLSAFVDGVVDANLDNGYDGTDLYQFEDDSFDVVVSIATLEHVGEAAYQKRFLCECKRVAAISSIHWFPYGEYAEKTEKFKERFKRYQHPCVVPKFEAEIIPYVTVSDHLSLLATIYGYINCIDTYEFIDKHGKEMYGAILIDEN